MMYLYILFSSQPKMGSDKCNFVKKIILEMMYLYILFSFQPKMGSDKCTFVKK